MVTFRDPQGPSFDLDRLKSTLNLSGIQASNNPLYQVIDQLLGAVQAFQRTATININGSAGDIAAFKLINFLTITDATPLLPNSRPTGLTGFTAGSVLFSDGASLIAQDNANFFWDNTNNRLGIGTNAPTSPLEIDVENVGTTNTPGIRLNNTTPATAIAPQQFSPRISFTGRAWDTTGAGASVANRLAIYARVLTGVNTAGYLAIADDSDGAGTFTDQFYIGSAVTGGSPDFRIRDGNILFRNSSRGIYYTNAPLTDTVPTSHFITATPTGKINLTPLTGGSEAFVEVEQNVFGIATGTIPCLRLRSFDNSTSTPQPGLLQRAVPGGTAAAGFGSRTWFQASSNTTSNQDQSAIDSVWNTATHASRSADLSFLLVHNAAALAEKLRIRSRGLLDVTAGYINWVGQKRVTVQFDKTNDAALANITGLSVNVEAARSYYFEAHLFVDADAVGGHQYAIAGTATATSIKYQIDSIDNTLNVYVINSREVALAGAAGQAGATVVETIIKGLIVVNAAGTLTVQFAQNAATPATTSSVLTDSTFVVQEIA
jgi:hypothetical protein